ncbi:WD40/YVTN/BNR-like repeat-containing protein [Novosphingobium pokkalii]|uniref:WD40/YVTN/BNR-like repeat-containing protein n=1 Tax=Novosphingobium pokkalii TaxID=1770194 RepID=UPI00362514CD
MGILSFAVDPNAPDRVYAATGLYLSQWSRKGAILRSDDRGRTWQKTELPIGVGGNSDGRGSGERLAVDPRNGDVLYFGSNRDGLWKSTDRGRSFARTGAGITGFSLVAADPAVANQVWAGSTDGSGALVVSHDGGASFAPVPGLPAMVPQHMVFGPDGSAYVTFAGGDQASGLNPSNVKTGAVWKRDGKDGHWHEITPKPRRPASWAAFPASTCRATARWRSRRSTAGHRGMTSICRAMAARTGARCPRGRVTAPRAIPGWSIT